jgi:succinate-semialdehyde dehydrogenase/glutarate-semialdehyde dehydrogenase
MSGPNAGLAAGGAQAATEPRVECLIGGAWVPGTGDPLTVLDKYRLQPFATLHAADTAQAQAAVAAAHAAFRQGVPSGYERGAVLERASRLVQERSERFVRMMQREAGFTAQDAGNEVRRCVETLRLSGEEARRLAGEVIPLDGAPQQSGRLAFTLRVPLGVVVAITPFNAPLNTPAHKIAPAFAAGNAVILKPASSTPFTAALLVEALVDAGMPAGFLSLLHGRAALAESLLEDQRVRFYAFTGSTEVGRRIQQAAGLRRTQMELGSIACTIVCADADLEHALPRIVNAGYRKAGQVCTSVQLLLVQRARLDEVSRRLATMVQSLVHGDPTQADTVVGPVISEAEARRIEAWIAEAVSRGATCLAGGGRRDAVVAPTLLAGIDDSMTVACTEIFGPVVCILPFDTLDQAIDRVNATPFGLAAGIFTNDLQAAFEAARRLEVGGVHVNETSSSRVDLMPYGGTKDSGFGREGPRYAMLEMTEERIVTFTPTRPRTR